MKLIDQINQFCLFLGPRDGGWGPWHPPSWDETPCVNGWKTRFRNCDNPCPANGGDYCSGSHCEIRDCDECADNDLNDCHHRDKCKNFDPPTRYTCDCHDGYRLLSDARTCESKHTCSL